MQRLINYTDDVIQRGQVIKCQLADNEALCLMVCEVVGEKYYQLIIINGYKAGLLFTYLPLAALDTKGFGLNANWLIENWHTWGYQACPIEQVYILSEPNADLFGY
jgi:hypothetical protein